MNNKYYYAVCFIHLLHWAVYIFNTLCIIPLMLYTPVYVWIPMCTMLANPLIGAQYCILNQLENKYRTLAGLPLLETNFTEVLIKRLYREHKNSPTELNQ